ncbi:rab GTPase-binding effector protein 1 [Caerostris extrusa]|uniref:Rab GTPase-binding effector protein 1 n=1 Tax=Caerostris extrusa TaxID=172846 RepID=A0AAV4MUI8_CAEEX|nr:rab GTPase-binding effector protein 1 [Caerostris extrusa]
MIQWIKKLYDKEMLEQFDESITFKNWRYEVKIPRKFDNIDHLNNYDVAKRRFEYLVTRFRKNPSLFKDQKAVMQEDMDKIKLELQEVCQLLEKEKKEHVQLKRTWQIVNDQFLETQRLQVMDIHRMQSVLTSEQQRQIAEAKKRNEQKMELESQMQNIEKKEK